MQPVRGRGREIGMHVAVNKRTRMKANQAAVASGITMCIIHIKLPMPVFPSVGVVSLLVTFVIASTLVHRLLEDPLYPGYQSGRGRSREIIMGRGS